MELRQISDHGNLWHSDDVYTDGVHIYDLLPVRRGER